MRRVGIAELKARLSEHVRYVRSGEEVVVLDRKTPVARLVPFSEPVGLVVRSAADDRSFWDVPVPEPVDLGFDVVELLLEERDADR